MKYFRCSFQSPLPWKGQDLSEYFSNVICRSFNPDGSVASYTQYSGSGLLGETAGWAIFTWFVTWLCVFRGVGLTGRVIYVTMGLPAVLIIILIGRGTSLPNASDGIKLYFATWRTSVLQSPKIWQDAFGQIFFSIGVGFGYLGLDPADGQSLGTFVTGFITYLEALAQVAGAPFFSVVFFFTLFLLGLTSAFSLLEVMTTLILDTNWGSRIPRWIVCTGVTVASALISLIYCTGFGLQALDAVDTYVNNVALFFVVWCECFAATSVYRCKDIADQVGWIGYLVYTLGFVSAQILGIGISYATTPEIGAGVGFAIYGASAIAGTLLAKTPRILAPRFWGNRSLLSRFWYLAFYSGNQLSRDLNMVIGVGKNWNIPMFWAPVMKYISGPILAIVLSFAYPAFRNQQMYDPTMIYGFSINHAVVPMVVIGFLLPSWFNWIIPSEKVALGDKPVAPWKPSTALKRSYEL
ncbi:hypothetical protein N0V86_004497 [Didymella sp. IMI 355093]|nr:hypothetical protein N0V86_004497 [Didymella sp. IMI 355093]